MPDPFFCVVVVVVQTCNNFQLKTAEKYEQRHIFS